MANEAKFSVSLQIAGGNAGQLNYWLFYHKLRQKHKNLKCCKVQKNERQKQARNLHNQILPLNTYALLSNQVVSHRD